MTDRRKFIRHIAAAGIGLSVPVELSWSLSRDTWDSGDVAHLIPAVNDSTILIKASFLSLPKHPPVLRVGSRCEAGIRTDTAGLFWVFRVDGLAADTEYELQLIEKGGRELSAPWPLRTFPSRDSDRSRFRLLVYTCAGGHDITRDPAGGGPFWVPVAERRSLLAAGLAFSPDAVVAIGDHVYWDLRAGKSARAMGDSPEGRDRIGEFRRSVPVMGTRNEEMLHRAVGPQIGSLYGTMLRSTPAFFVQDDHDYFENDHADNSIVTFPPDDFMLQLARATQRMYYPEWLPDRDRPPGLPGTINCHPLAGLSECFGTIRYGQLLEAMLYDCRRFLSLKGPAGGFLPATVEQWLHRRMAHGDARHIINVPSAPPGWSAGKWAEWYPDSLTDDGVLVSGSGKYLWQEGWQQQHDRLLDLSSRHTAVPLFLSGDLHAIGYGRIYRSGSLALDSNPVHTVLTGPISTGPPGWPSAFRGTPPQVPNSLQIDEVINPVERNGFTVLDVEPDRILLRFFSWKLGEAPVVPGEMQPFRTVELEPKG